MGLLDTLNTPAGLGLLSGVASYAANARRGAPINSIGRGFIGGLAGYQSALDNIQKQKEEQANNAYKQVLMQQMQQNMLLDAEKLRRSREDDESAGQIFDTILTDANIDPNTGGFLKVSNEGQQVQSTPYEVQPYPIQQQQPLTPEMGEMPLMQGDLSYTPPQPPKPANPFEDVYKELGWTPGRIKMFNASLRASPESAMKDLRSAYIEMDRANRKGRIEARDVLAKERALAEAMGMPVRDYLISKFNKPSNSVTVQNFLGEPKAVTLPDGTQAFMQFPKGGGEPVLVKGAMPPAGDSEQMAAGYGSRMAESENIIRKIGEKGHPTIGTSIAGALPGGLGRYTQSVSMSPEQQMHRQAQEDWVRAKLRKESGAVIAEEEMEREISTYFPKPGDTPQVIAQKQKAREVAIQSMRRAAGPAGSNINKPQSTPTSGMRRYNPATGRIENASH